MIVPMKKIDILVLDKYREECLIDLRRLGVLHVKYIEHPSSLDIESLQKKIEETEKALIIISRYLADKRGHTYVDKEMIFSQVSQIGSLDKEKGELRKKKEQIEDGLLWYKDWGEFSLDSLRELAKEGIYIRLYKCAKRDWEALREKRAVGLIKKQGGDYYIAVISFSEKDEINLAEVIPPSRDLGVLKEELLAVESRISNIDNLLKDEANYKRALSDYSASLKNSLDFSRVKSSMQGDGGLVCLEGFVPNYETRRFIDLANRKGWAYLIRDPDNPQEVPTLIKNPGWLRMIEPVFRFMGVLPGYNEYDISFSFLLFLTVFFALLIGDAGYGLIFLLVTYLIKKRTGNISPEPFNLMYLLSIATIIWGAVSGTWFGFEKIAQLPFLKTIVIDKINSFVDSNQSFMMYISFLIGAVHLTIAHSIAALRMINSLKSLARLGWILIIWSLFFIAEKLILGKNLPGYAGLIFPPGIILVLLFSYPQKNILKGIGLALADSPLKIVSSFADIISYLRLFAVGYASVAVANSFNNIALGFGFNSVLRTLISAIILFLGHGLNILLGLMAVIVHGVRLNMLEFSSHLGMQWAGIEYKPFKE